LSKVRLNSSGLVFAPGMLRAACHSFGCFMSSGKPNVDDLRNAVVFLASWDIPALAAFDLISGKIDWEEDGEDVVFSRPEYWPEKSQDDAESCAYIEGLAPGVKGIRASSTKLKEPGCMACRVVLCKLESGYHSYVTWRQNYRAEEEGEPRWDETYWGHYFDNFDEANTDYVERCVNLGVDPQ
jgi:hypothetical protein